MNDYSRFADQLDSNADAHHEADGTERRRAATALRELESALASERAKTAAAEEEARKCERLYLAGVKADDYRQMASRTLAAEATIAHARKWRESPDGMADLDTILAAAPTAALDAALAEAPAGALEALIETWGNDWSDYFDVDEQVGSAEVVGDWLRAQLSQIREAQK